VTVVECSGKRCLFNRVNRVRRITRVVRKMLRLAGAEWPPDVPASAAGAFVATGAALALVDDIHRS
jgi:hypothetical protein